MQCMIYACIWILDSLNPSCNLSEPYPEHILVGVLFIILTIYCKIGIKMWILLSAVRAAGVPWDSEWMVAIRRLCQNQYLLGLHVPCLQELIYIYIDAPNDANGSMYLHRLPDSNIALIRKSSQKKINYAANPSNLYSCRYELLNYSFQGG